MQEHLAVKKSLRTEERGSGQWKWVQVMVDEELKKGGRADGEESKSQLRSLGND